MVSEVMRRSASVEIAVSPPVAFDAVCCLGRMGEWSPENVGGRWLEGDGGRVGDRFEGDNRQGDLEWTLPVTVSASDPGALFAFHTGPAEHPWVQWTYRIESAPSGCVVTEVWELLDPAPFVASLGPDYPSLRAEQMERDLVTTLERLKRSLESAA